MGPSLIFDKSTLESLNLNDAVWLDHFFRSSITPLFFIETLADLEKEFHAGRTPEQVVGNLARKTPDMNSYPALHHSKLLDVELSGTNKVMMDGRPVLYGARPVKLNNSKGLIFSKTQEEDAFLRWQKGEFLQVERQIAKFWRRNLCNLDYDATYAFFQRFFPGGKKPTELSELKILADTYVDRKDQEKSLKVGLSLLGYSLHTQNYVMTRWQNEGKPKLRDFSPYFCHVYCVDLFFYLAIAADLISRVRPAGKADNKVDIAYVYYLPFCKVFTSNDNLHARVVPLFLGNDKSFIKGQELKAELQKLNAHCALLPEEVKARGLQEFARQPPTETTFLITRLWDRYVANWRSSGAPAELSEEAKNVLLNLVNRFQDASQPANPAEQYTIADSEFIQVQRRISPHKGDWRRVPPGVENKK